VRDKNNQVGDEYHIVPKNSCNPPSSPKIDGNYIFMLMAENSAAVNTRVKDVTLLRLHVIAVTAI
jgi:hypothetical protein